MAQYARTRKQCPGCGEMEYIKVGEICGECKRRLADYGQLRADLAARNQDTRIYRVPDTPRYVTNYGTGGRAGRSDPQRRQAQEAMGQLIHALSEPYYRQAGDPSGSVGWLLTRREIAYGFDTGHKIRLRPDLVALIVQLDQAIADLVAAAYAEGKRDGASLLNQLAGDALTLTEFNDRTLGAKKE